MIVNIVFGKNEKKKKENDIHEECEEKETGKMLNCDKFMSLKKIKEEPSILKFLWNELAKEKENWRKEKKQEKYRLDEEIKYKRDMLEKYIKEQKEMIKEQKDLLEKQKKDQSEYKEEMMSLVKLLKEELIEEKNRFHEDIKEKKEELKKKEEELNKREKELEKKFKSSENNNN